MMKKKYYCKIIYLKKNNLPQRFEDQILNPYYCLRIKKLFNNIDKK